MIEFDTIYALLQNNLTEPGFEVYPFLISWYNSIVDPLFRLSTYDDDTVAFLVVSTPSMFEKTFLPYALDSSKDLSRDPIDCCVKEKIQSVIENIPDCDIDVMFDYELWPTRRPKIVMQTVSHVAGAARFYSRQQLANDPFPKDRNMMGICLHPKYGGWFALRSVLVFKTLKYPLLPRISPIDVLNGDESLVVDVLKRFNDCWEDNSYRNVIPATETYSSLQQSYFQTKPKDRLVWLENLRQTYKEKH
ncbi:unnamed protein product [Rotaria socialis]|uniref:Cyanocobalamin reductase (cyanide-eliminating) n=2 Tax=Rotaria socialis TaxID=392032 RepID=A0A817QW88_9BILA|nr:unnamed protein product [Rotaria socialis]CAF3522567.1 unnamed protein product [Rotaria socialis]CAF3697388.1 unnamed protein product [Rotaria socialis]CAF4092405.1 unnamed protein product [Rotaria socialis]CAF4214969.1 unnamed protein product [Rotaria socialis]